MTWWGVTKKIKKFDHVDHAPKWIIKKSLVSSISQHIKLYEVVIGTQIVWDVIEIEIQ